MASALIPASVTDPALRVLLDALISATGISSGGGGGGPSPLAPGKRWRLMESRYPTQTGPMQALLQWQNGTRWETRLALDANGNVTVGGNIVMTGANQASSNAVKNALNPSNLCKAWALLTIGTAPAVTVTAGFNIASATWTGTTTSTVIMSQPMANTSYVVLPVFMGLVSTGMTAIANSTTSFTFGPGGGGGNMAPGQLYGVAVFGAQ